jgi:hypothetical protein
MAKKISVAVLVCSLGLAALMAGATPDSAPPVATETITEADLKSTVYFLASKEMQGRELNTLFNKITSSWREPHPIVRQLLQRKPSRKPT